jgi:zinc protease
MIRRGLDVAALIAWSLIAVACASSSSAAPVMQGAVLRVLPNGLRLIVREQHAAQLVAIDAWVRAGSGREMEGESGAAHFLEHLLFKGTPTRKPGEIDAAIEDLGATLSAYTLRDAAHFGTTVPSTHARVAFEVLADALRNSVLDPAEVERERSVILDELARAGNDSHKSAVNLLYGQLARGTGYSRPVLGDTNSIRALSRDTIAAFYKRWHTPSNTTLVMVGDVTADHAEELVKEAFGSWSGTSPKAPDLEPKLGSEALKPVTATGPTVPAGNRLVATAYAIVSANPSQDSAVGLVLAALLGDARTGRIAASLSPGPASSAKGAAPPRTDIDVTGEYSASLGPSLLILTAQGPTARMQDARTAIDSVIESLGMVPPSQGMLDAARRAVIGPYLYDIETYAGQASALGQYDVLGDYTGAQTLVDRILALKPVDISTFVRTRLTASRRADLVMDPPAHP